MTLKNLLKTGLIKTEPFNQLEFDNLIQSGKARLKDAHNKTLALESQFDLAYNAAHSLALAALRQHGYRATNRYVVFQALTHTANLGEEVWRVLAKCHNYRNIAEYEGHFDVDNQLLEDLLIATQILLEHI